MKLYITQSCTQVDPIRKILDDLRLSYQVLDVEANEDAAKHLRQIANGNLSVPTIVFPNGSFMVEPSEYILRVTLDKNLYADGTMALFGQISEEQHRWVLWGEVVLGYCVGLLCFLVGGWLSQIWKPSVEQTTILFLCLLALSILWLFPFKGRGNQQNLQGSSGLQRKLLQSQNKLNRDGFQWLFSFILALIMGFILLSIRSVLVDIVINFSFWIALIVLLLILVANWTRRFWLRAYTQIAAFQKFISIFSLLFFLGFLLLNGFAPQVASQSLLRLGLLFICAISLFMTILQVSTGNQLLKPVEPMKSLLFASISLIAFVISTL